MADALDKYREKRDFSKTPEPGAGAGGPSGNEPRFVVQKHAARRMHYDMRFEVDGVMPSWAVPKGPSYDPKVKRLAMHTEDHPLDYQTFEGIIPKGEYGGGTVVVWDNGTYRNTSTKDGKPVPMREAINRGHFSVSIEGTKLHGGWAFTRTGPASNKHESWIVVKRKDEFADPTVDITKVAPDSVASGRSLEAIAGDREADQWTAAVATWAPPMLADRSEIAPKGENWVYERKLDGLRCVAVRNGDDVTLWSRNHLSFDARFPKVIEALRQLPADNFVLDGELVAFDSDRTSFTLLQRPAADTEPLLYLFDITHLLGRDTRELSLLQRKDLLRQVVTTGPPLHVVEQVTGDGDELLKNACRDGWEGLIAKRVDATYVPGRSSAWKKLKCSASQELVIAGWTEARGTRVGFGALLVGYYEAGLLRYAGKVGTGFDDKLLRSLHKALKEHELTESPFADEVKEKTAHWTEPALVANIAFTEWTRDGKLRHPKFQGLRPDKEPTEVIRERGQV